MGALIGAPPVRNAIRLRDHKGVPFVHHSRETHSPQRLNLEGH